MIANEGFEPLSVVFETMYSELLRGAEQYLRVTSDSLNSLAINRPEDLAKSWMFRYFENELYLCDGTSSPTRIDLNLVYSGRYFVEFAEGHFANENVQKPKFSEELRRTFGICDPLSDDLITQNEQLDYDGSEESDQRLLNLLEEAFSGSGMCRPLVFVEAQSFCINLDLYRALERHEPDELSNVASEKIHLAATKLKPFEGRFLAVPQSCLGEDWSNYCRAIAENKIKDRNRERQIPSETSKRSGGRPSKQGPALQAYQRLYPNGHAGSSWKEVERSIQQRCGLSVSAQTIKAALKNR